MHSHPLSAAVAILATPLCAIAADTQPYPGDYLVASRTTGAIYAVDPATGLFRGLVSGRELRDLSGTIRGDGQRIGNAFSLSIVTAPGGDILARYARPSGWGIVSVDHLTGDRAVLPGTDSPAWEDSGELFLLDDHTVVSAADDYENDLAGDGLLLAYDLASGVTSIVSGGGVGDGPQLLRPRAVARLDEGTLLVAESMLAFPPEIGAGLYAVSLASGDRALVSRLSPFPFTRPLVIDGNVAGQVLLGDDEGGAGPVLNVTARSIAVRDGTIYAGIAIDRGVFDGGVLAIDPATGDRTLVVGRAMRDDGTNSGVVEQIPPNMQDIFLDQPIGLTITPAERLAFTCLWGPSVIYELEIPTGNLYEIADIAAQVHPDFVGVLELHGLTMYEGTGCPADFNADQAIDTRDLLLFLNLWTSRNPRADINADGRINSLDVIAFLNLWNAGCG
ncbi:MAG TPA: GC-type dockerin domain-anchored protein [Phycisphaerales bacterium]|nr:GC-type dockerin domain-anchored protein [Phycisphaerales bacterium]